MSGRHIRRMAIIRSVKFNAIMNVALTASNMLVALVTLPYVTRVLSVEGYGAVGFAQSTSAWFSTFCLLGIPIYGIRECARARDNPTKLAKTVKELLILITIFTGIVLVIFAACIIWIPRFRADSTLLWLFLINILLVSYGFEWFYQALEQYTYITVRSALFKIASLLLIFIFVKDQDDYIFFGAILALVTCGNNLFNIIHLRTLVSLDLSTKVDIRQHIKPVFSFGMVNVSSSVYLWLDTVILGFLTPGNYQVGLYQLASKLKSFLGTVINAATNAAIPRLAYYQSHQQKENFFRLLRNSMSLIINIGLCIVGYFLVFSDQVIIFISSEKYIQSTLTLQIISIAMFFSAVNSLIGFQILTPLGKESKLALANSAGVPVSLIANISLDPFFGAAGAATAASLTEIIVFMIQIYYARETLRNAFEAKEMVKIFSSVAIAVVLSAVLRETVTDWNNLEILSSSLFSYILVWLLCLFLFKERSIGIVIKTLTNMLHRR